MSVKHFINGDGFVERMEVFGSDLTVVNAARVSFAKESLEMTQADERLIRYLARNAHITPFFHPQIRFRLRMPIFIAREWFRHTVGFSRNEVSRRYVDDMPTCWKPVDALRLRDKSVKQGSQNVLHPDENALLSEWSVVEKQILKFYDDLLKKGVAPEVARGILPQSMMTEFIETGSLYAYARLCKLRLDSHAQKEIREYAEKIHQCLILAFPVSWKYLMEKEKITNTPLKPITSESESKETYTPPLEKQNEPIIATIPENEPIIVTIPENEPIIVIIPENDDLKIKCISDETCGIQMNSDLIGYFGIGC
jgi:thymidylate synthase (FAD)